MHPIEDVVMASSSQPRQPQTARHAASPTKDQLLPYCRLASPKEMTPRSNTGTMNKKPSLAQIYGGRDRAHPNGHVVYQHNAEDPFNVNNQAAKSRNS